MKNQTINSVDPASRMIVNEPNRAISILCDSSHPSYILTTSPSPLTKESILHVQGHGEYYCYHGSYTRRANMQSYLIMLTLSGNELLEYQGHHYEMGPGSFYWIDCMEPHYFFTMEKEQPRHAMWIHFYGPTAEFYYRQFLRLNNNSHVCLLPNNSTIEDDIKELIRMYHNSAESPELDIAASAIVLRIIVACIQATTLQQVQSPMPKVIQAVKSHITRNYHVDITLDALSEKFSVNKFHLQKQFKRYTGLSPNEFLIHTRLSRAKELLRSTDNSINQIAAEVGFGNASHFTRMFKKYENTTPINYRRNWLDPHLTIVESDSVYKS